MVCGATAHRGHVKLFCLPLSIMTTKPNGFMMFYCLYGVYAILLLYDAAEHIHKITKLLNPISNIRIERSTFKLRHKLLYATLYIVYEHICGLR